MIQAKTTKRPTSILVQPWVGRKLSNKRLTVIVLFFEEFRSIFSYDLEKFHSSRGSKYRAWLDGGVSKRVWETDGVPGFHDPVSTSLFSGSRIKRTTVEVTNSRRVSRRKEGRRGRSLGFHIDRE
jgi:hypothetical protein